MIQEGVYRSGIDGILNVPYEIGEGLATDVSAELKGYLSSLGIAPEEFNSFEKNKDNWSSNSAEEKKSIDSPPNEIYEYQNFFLMKRRDGNIVLLDGFRRLLWYKVPANVRIAYRIYDQLAMDNKQVLKLLVSLNHTKFFAGIGDYFDRGFALALNICFGLNILKYDKAFRAYLQASRIEQDHSGLSSVDRQKAAELVTQRILSDSFIDDMLFVQSLPDGLMINSNFGSLLWTVRQGNLDLVLDAEIFASKVASNKHLKELHAKYKITGDGRGSEACKVINRILEQYRLIFDDMAGGAIKESYLDAKARIKKMSDQIKKDTKWIKYSDDKSLRLEIYKLIEANGNKSPKVKIVVHPTEYMYETKKQAKELLEIGVHDDFYIKEVRAYDRYNGVMINIDIKHISKDVMIRSFVNKYSLGSTNTGTDTDKGIRYCMAIVDVYISREEFSSQPCELLFNERKNK